MLKRTVTLPMVRLLFILVVIPYIFSLELSSGITTARGCGVGGDLVQYLQVFSQEYNNLKFSIFCSFDVFRSPRIPLCQGTPYVFWENSVCFSRPGFNDTQEVRYCFVVVDIS